jgi:hypothetical protein
VGRRGHAGTKGDFSSAERHVDTPATLRATLSASPPSHPPSFPQPAPSQCSPPPPSHTRPCTHAIAVHPLPNIPETAPSQCGQRAATTASHLHVLQTLCELRIQLLQAAHVPVGKQDLGHHPALGVHLGNRSRGGGMEQGGA